MKIFHSPFGDVKLDRLPLQNNELQQAWDAADELLLQHVADSYTNLDNIKRVLIINDQFGCLTIALNTIAGISISSWSDSYTSELAIEHNRILNNQPQAINFIASTQIIEEHYDLILIKIPKVLALLEVQVNGLGEMLAKGGRIIASGMCKHMSMNTYPIFEKHIGATITSLAKKKARLIFIDNEKKRKVDLPYPTTISEPQLGLSLKNEANVFSKDHLDIGARFFIEHFSKLPKANTIIDLGCGNGVLGIMVLKQQLTSHLHFVDESHMALHSAALNVDTAFDAEKPLATFHTSHCLEQYNGPNADLILCNPPFHQQHSTGDQVAWRMFNQSYNKLNPNGELWVVANRNLGYHIKLKRLFANCITVASNKKFVILKAIKKH